MVPLTFSCRSHLLYICCLQLSIQSFLGEEDLQRCPAVVSVCTFHVHSQCRHRAYDGTWSSSFVRRSLTNPLTFPSQCWCFWSSDKLESSIELTVDLECHSHEQKRKLKGTSCLHKLNPLGCIKARPEHVAIALRETERLR